MENILNTGKQDLISRIAKRQTKLQSVALDLKGYFVGLDSVIDKIISSIESWYCMPELLTRPTIVCLWGLTGNGKTDLVRRLVASLGVTDSFVELQMTNKGSSQHGSSTLKGLLDHSNISTDEPGILLLDEIQRFRSVDGDGKEIHDYSFQDLWMLLSDGSFGNASSNKQDLIELMLDIHYSKDYQNAASMVDIEVEETEATKKQNQRQKELAEKRKFKQSFWEAKILKRKLRLVESVEEIMQWDDNQKIDVISNCINNKSVYRQEVYSKLLVFISGNIDEAYGMADQTEETDIEADLFHKHSLKINLITIKSALRSRFKPEQIARFGNTHVIYPALSRASYEAIIYRKVDEVLKKIKTNGGIEIIPEESVYKAIYRNGVFPAQGTRPVFSTISSFFESSLPTFTLKAMELGLDKINLVYEDKCLQSKIGDETVVVKNEGDIDKIKSQKRNNSQICKVSVHEAGHAVTYACLFGYVPTQVSSLGSSNERNGFVGVHSIDGNKEFLMKEISVFLAGRAAEEIVFGNQSIGAGATGDINRATNYAAAAIRQYAMMDGLSKVTTTSSPDASGCNTDISCTNPVIEEILQEQYKIARSLLQENESLLIALSEYLIQHEKIEPKEFIELFDKFGIQVEYLDAKETIYPKFETIFSTYKKNLGVERKSWKK